MFGVVLLALLGASVLAHDDAHAHESHHCIHDTVQALAKPTVDPQVFSWGDSVEDRKRQTTVNTQPLRVHFDTFNLGNSALDCKRAGQVVTVNRERITCRAQDVLDQQTKDVIIRVLNDIKSDVARIFNIVRATKTEIRGGSWCFDRNIDISRYTSASNSAIKSQIDMMVMVTAWPTSGSTLAWAGYCRSNQFGRPIAAHANFGAGAMAGKSYGMIKATAMHELFHAMGFTAQRMRKFLSSTGRVVSGVSKFNVGSSSDGTKAVAAISAAQTLAAARDHFSCGSMKGLELEDHRINSDIGSHWEQRTMGNEIMTPQIAPDSATAGMRISRMTLAYFADMGVYYPDFREAEPFAYGRGQGCGFVQRPTRTRADAYTCPRNARSNRCNPEGTAYSSCQWFRYGSALPLFQQPSTAEPTMGGNQYSDYAVEGGAFASCNDPRRASGNGQTSGPQSRCIYNTVVQRGWRRDSFGAGCFELQCPAGRVGPAPTTPRPTTPRPTTARPTTTTTRPGTTATRTTSARTTTRATPRPTTTTTPASTNFRLLSTCEECANARGTWCDRGWLYPAWTRAGVCLGPSEGSCPSYAPKAVTSASRCYPTCTYSTWGVGTCRSRSYCSAVGGGWATERVGGRGCERQPKVMGGIYCCITHRRGKKRDTDALFANATLAVADEHELDYDPATADAEPLPTELVSAADEQQQQHDEEAEEAVEHAHEKRASNELQIKVADRWFDCPRNGGELSVNTGSFAGKVRCPSLESACCASLSYCSGHGTCTLGACVCDSGYEGDSCASRVAAPSGKAPSRASWSNVRNFVEEEPLLDLPEESDNELGRELEENDFANIDFGDAPLGAPEDAADGGDSALVIVGVVVLVLLVIAIAIAVAIYVVKKRSASSYA